MVKVENAQVASYEARDWTSRSRAPRVWKALTA